MIQFKGFGITVAYCIIIYIFMECVCNLETAYVGIVVTRELTVFALCCETSIAEVGLHFNLVRK